MSKSQPSFFDSGRKTLEDSIELTVQSLNTYGTSYKHWAIAYSGGKDSSALLSVVLYLIKSGKVEKPESLTVLYSDTRQELPPLQIGAIETLKKVRSLGFEAKIVLPEIDKRYFVYMLGRGVPPPNNNTLRWCTSQIKVQPMINALRELRDQCGEKFLMLTGVRIGESVVRDARIALSCSRNGGECGQGWFQHSTPSSVADTLAPILHWRVCHVWDWLMFEAPSIIPSVSFVAQVYGGEEAEEINARTGCTGCPLATKDTALDHVLSIPEWAYLQPLKRLRPLYAELRRFKYRKQKNGERNSDGKYSANPSRKGPLTLSAREWGLQQVLDIQNEINAQAVLQHKQEIKLIDGLEEERIRELIRLRTYPNRWSDSDPDANILIPQTFSNGMVQSIFSMSVIPEE
ncbi:MAG: phosphoadenosine phosphosulfate reductase family protein [Syntrophaceae bacterium]